MIRGHNGAGQFLRSGYLGLRRVDLGLDRCDLGMPRSHLWWSLPELAARRRGHFSATATTDRPATLTTARL